MKTALAALLFLGLTTLTNASEIRMMTENYPPYNMEVEGELQGLSVEILEAMLIEMDLKKDKYDIELLSWSKAFDTAKNVKNNMLFSAIKTEKRKNQFKWVGPISKTVIGITAKKDRHIVINSLEDLKKYKIGCVKKDMGETMLLEADIPRENILALDGVNSLPTMFYKLERGRIDMLSYEVKVVKYSADLNGFDSDEYEGLYILKKAEHYFAFNKLTSDKIIEKWQKALDTIKSNGIYDKIVKKY